MCVCVCVWLCIFNILHEGNEGLERGSFLAATHKQTTKKMKARTQIHQLSTTLSHTHTHMLTGGWAD